MANVERRNLVGIDLGTTMSVIAYLDPTGAVVTIPNSDGDPLTPSAIYVDGNQVVVGKAAKQASSHMPDKVATFVKREMGRPLFSRTIDGRNYRPEMLSALIIRKLKQDAERKIGSVRRAVITVPAYFDDARRKATEDAGRIAGLEVVDILNEPTSAALSYCLEGQLHRGAAHVPDFPDGKLTALVYDLGGGTFDVTAIRLQSKRIDTLATDGAVKLGGKDWDDRIVDYVAKEFGKRFGIEIPGNRRDAIGNQAETTKKLLSQLPNAEVECYFQDRSMRVALTRSQFEEMTRDLLTSTEIVTKLVLKQAKLHADGREATWNDFDRILLVGGSTRMPMIKSMLRRVTGKEPDDRLDPDQVVARGAAIYANILAARGKEGILELDDEVRRELNQVDIVDVNAHSLGVEAFSRKDNKSVNVILIPKNHQLPYAFSRVFPLREPGATTVRVRVLEGEAPEPEANIELGECVVHDLPPNLPARSPIQVRLCYGTNGRVNVTALDMTGGRYAQAEIERKSNMTEADIQRESEFVRTLTIQ